MQRLAWPDAPDAPAQNEMLSRRLRVWQRNAHARNNSVDMLDEQWDEIDRGQAGLKLHAGKGLPMPLQGLRQAKR